MSERGRDVLRAIDLAFEAQEHHPRLFGRYRTLAGLAAAFERYRGNRSAVDRADDRWEGDPEAERVDPEWEGAHARARGERWEKRKRGIDADRRMARAEMSRLDLHRHAVERAGRLSTVGASTVGRQSPNSERQNPGPPGQQQLDDDPRWRETWQIIGRRLEAAHRLLDEYEGLGATAESTMTAAEKDRRILIEGRGHSCEAVVDLLGREVAGSPRTVWRKRKNTQCPPGEPDRETDEFRILGYAVRTSDGEPLDAPEVVLSKPGLRRVRVDADR